MSIYNAIQVERDKIIQEKARLPDLQSVLDAKRQARSQLTETWQIRLRQTLDSEIQELDRRVENITSGTAEALLERRISPYINAYERERTAVYAPSRSAVSCDAGTGLWSTHPGGKLQDVVHEMREEFNPSAFRNRVATQVFTCDCGTHLSINTRTSVLVCQQCGAETSYIDTTPAHTAFNDDSCRDRRRYEYDRAVHFNSKMAHLQGKEPLEVPIHVIDLVMAELFRTGTRVTTVHRISHSDIRAVLKLLNRSHPGMRKYYENTSQIRSRITGIPCICLPDHVEDRCREMFVLLQPVFEELRVTMLPGRKNFLNYSFTLYKILQIIGVATNREHHTLLKGEEKIKQQDLIFRAICERLGWEWVPTPGM